MAKTNETKAGPDTAQAGKPVTGAEWADWAESQEAARLAYQVVQALQGEDDMTFNEAGLALGFGLPRSSNTSQKVSTKSTA